MIATTIINSIKVNPARVRCDRVPTY